MPQIERIARPLLRDEAYRVIREAIVTGALAPGAVIRDAELAARVGLSRTPVREALARLVDEGLVESKPNAFTRVTPLLRREVRDAFVVLRALHELAARTAVPVMTRAHLAALRTANRRFAAALDAGDVEAALAADDDFHGVLVGATGNRVLAATIERLAPMIRRLERLRFGSLPGRGSIRDHDRIIRACAAGDADAAARLTAANWATLGEQIARAFAAVADAAVADAAVADAAVAGAEPAADAAVADAAVADAAVADAAVAGAEPAADHPAPKPT